VSRDARDARAIQGPRSTGDVDEPRHQGLLSHEILSRLGLLTRESGRLATPVTFDSGRRCRPWVTVAGVSEEPEIVDLSPEECLKRLHRVSLGRIALSIGALPAIRSVRFVLSGHDVVFRVRPVSRLYRAASNSVVAFHADYVDEQARDGWAVQIQGVGRPVTDAVVLQGLRSLPLASWSATPSDDAFVRIATSHMSGERVRW
jgi:hypothetical protein